MQTEPVLFALPDPLALILGAAGFFAVLITLRFVAATMLPAGHRLSRAAEAIDAPLWAVKPATHDTTFPHPGAKDGGSPPCP